MMPNNNNTIRTTIHPRENALKSNLHFIALWHRRPAVVTVFVSKDCDRGRKKNEEEERHTHIPGTL